MSYCMRFKMKVCSIPEQKHSIIHRGICQTINRWTRNYGCDRRRSPCVESGCHFPPEKGPVLAATERGAFRHTTHVIR